MTPLALEVVTGYLALVAVLALLAALGLRCGAAVRTGVFVAEVLLIGQALLDLVAEARGHRPADTATHLGYVVVSLLLLPLILGRATSPSTVIALGRPDSVGRPDSLGHPDSLGQPDGAGCSVSMGQPRSDVVSARIDHVLVTFGCAVAIVVVVRMHATWA